MAFFKNLFSLAVGAAIGCVATLALQQYEQDQDHTQGPEADYIVPEAPKAAPEPESAPAAPVYRKVERPADPEENPVAATTPKPPMKDGKIDASKIASPEDFADWDDFGCKG